MMQTDLVRAIYRTLAYFSYFRFPLTTREVFAWLLVPAQVYTYDEVAAALTSDAWLRARVDFFGEYVSLRDCEVWVVLRNKRKEIAARKWQVARRAASFFARIPGVLAVGVCNSLAFDMADEASDVDFFFVTKPGRVWSVRFLATLPLRLFHLRPGDGTRDPLCVSFFVDARRMCMQDFLEGNEDYYLAYWTTSVRFLFAQKDFFTLWQEKNAWVHSVLPHASFVPPVRSMPFQVPLFIPQFLARFVQQVAFPPELVARAQDATTHVVITDDVLKFHVTDARRAIQDHVQTCMREAGL